MCEDPTDDIEILVSDDAARQFLSLYQGPCDLSTNTTQRNTLKKKVRFTTFVTWPLRTHLLLLVHDDDDDDDDDDEDEDEDNNETR